MSGAEVSATWEFPEESLSARSCGTGTALGLTSLHCGQTPRARMIHELIEGGLGAAPVLSRAITSTDGTFFLEGLPEGSVALWVLSSEGVALKLDVATGQQDVTLVLAPGLPGVGRVVDEHLVPVANVRVTLFLAEHSRYFQTVTDAEGRFALGRLPHWDSRRSANAPASNGGEDSRWRYGLTLSSPGLVPLVRNDQFLDELAAKDIVMHGVRSIAGQVLLDDRPVAGALVDTYASMSPLETDEQGRFLLEGVAPGGYLFSARHGPHRGEAGVLLREEQTQAEVTVRLGTLFQVVGTVRDDEGQPIPDAIVHLTSQRDPIMGGTIWTHEDGRFVYEYVNPGPVSFVASQVDGYLESERVYRDVTVDTAPVELVMKRASVMEGVLTNTAGEPIPDGRLTAMRWLREHIPLEPPQEPFADGSVHQATADEQGRFAFDLPEAGLYLITAQAKGFFGTHMGATAPSSAVKVVMRAAARVRGVVVDTSGEPVAEVFLTLQQEGEEDSSSVSAQTSPQGRFLFEMVLPGRYALQAEHPLGKSFEVLRALPVVVRGSETQEVTIQMKVGPRVSGQVVDENGAPMPDVVVVGAAPEELAGAAPGIIEMRRRTVTNQHGRFTLLHMPRGDCRLTAVAQGYILRGDTRQDRSEPGVLARGGDTQVKLVMEVKHRESIRGRVVGEDRAPRLTFEINGKEYRSPLGTFHLTQVKPGPTRLMFEVPGLTRMVREVQVRPGEDVDLGEVVLKQGQWVRGRVLDARTSEPLIGVEVVVTPPPASSSAPGSQELGERLAMTTTGPGGLFELPPVEHGPLQMKVHHPQYLPHEELLASGDASLDVRLMRAPRVDGTLVDRDGRPVLATVWATPLSHSEHGKHSDDPPVRGAFRITGLRPGDYSVSVDSTVHPGGDSIRFIPQWVRLGDGESRTLHFKEQVGQSTLKLRLVGASEDPQEPLADVQINSSDVFPMEPPPITSIKQWRWATNTMAVPSRPTWDTSREGTDTVEDRLTIPDLPLGRYTYFLLGSDRRTHKNVMHRGVVDISSVGVVTVDVRPQWVVLP
ncbi:hypothetical protein WA016_05872 [Myxococcus stipitatus]